MKMKYIKVIVIMSFFLFSFTACSLVSTKSESTENTEPTIPNNAIVAESGNVINLYDTTIELPKGMNYGVRKNEYGTFYYVWKAEKGEIYLMPNSNDIVLYIFEGNDKTSPATELTDAQARNSMTQTYIQTFRNQLENAKFNIDAGQTVNTWYTLCFTGYGGSENIVTTYGVSCYPKSYYGICVLERECKEDYSRNYYGFVFSNDSNGNIITEEEYNDLFSQIRNDFSIESFFTLPQNSLTYDVNKDTSQGYSYEQFNILFEDTKNFYNMTSHNTEEISSENEETIQEYISSTEEKELGELYNIERVVDGDTIVVKINNTDTTVRLIGIDTPESVHSDQSKNTEEGKEASEWTKNLLENKQVYLEYDIAREDTYGRSLAYVYLDDGVTMVNRTLLEQGMAKVMTIQPNSKYANEFYQLQIKARETGSGFWGTGFFETENK